MHRVKSDNDAAERCRLNDYAKFVSKEEMDKFREEYAAVFRSHKDKNGKQVFSEEDIRFEAYEYLTDEDLAMYIYNGQTPKGLADIMSM